MTIDNSGNIKKPPIDEPLKVRMGFMQSFAVILPMAVIRLLDALLEPSKEKVLDMKKQLDRAGIANQHAALNEDGILRNGHRPLTSSQERSGFARAPNYFPTATPQHRQHKI
ncbi:hypothetical protein LJB86_03150 [Deltaproteobacteria bacterium OttesenSCG-928-M10]|nr:hypothetical protein [Deltaproteobacteria bacterium OttesenSCG-928-M10]